MLECFALNFVIFSYNFKLL